MQLSWMLVLTVAVLAIVAGFCWALGARLYAKTLGKGT